MRKMMKRAGAVVLSLAVAMSMLFSLAALPQMKVSAAEKESVEEVVIGRSDAW